jgi:hypothetical protein
MNIMLFPQGLKDPFKKISSAKKLVKESYFGYNDLKFVNS